MVPPAVDHHSLILTANTLKEYQKVDVGNLNEKQLCVECLLPVEKIRRCGKCLHAVYCGKECQTKAWKAGGHKICCGVVKVVCTGGEKGYGVVAHRDIKEGDVVMMEKPLLNVPHSLHKRAETNNTLLSLDDSVKRKLMSLYSNHKTGVDKLPSIIRIHCFLSKTGNILVYNMISRLNHSCIPNIRVDVTSTDPNLEFTPVVALRAIRKGEELVYDYLVESGKYSSRKERKLKLNERFAISHCQCKACSLDGARLIQSDNNRRQLKEVEQQLKTTINFREAEGLIEKKRQLLEAEGLDTMNHVMMLTKDLLQASRSRQDVRRYKEEGLRYAERLHDQEMITFFNDESERALQLL